ncbi:MAG: 50S ribosomal protein L25 [Candidatus Collierbacteria bacterium GW2011_GWF2_44_15]|uniref:Large ribosomal subunit protein bL25 n=3 Tax=Candidatus Collieribacteriota TaxID=1752725 RepID=A0A0G1JRL2_9BACT|nr:MAG: 50S ribosomal protein L25 [Candidatus Collierbacteria bacterium GW2011_GWF1_44_12]KKT46557.1 MAG: 50S ribosomal protein L25 [Candidatus Collierbacteria bacterium GW2011_GWF2_44_15]KKU29724.1 MAG: 50S ribosomal protein L25 [Candidatus Collierbacteria bacterium GW2011_GWE1_46_18]
MTKYNLEAQKRELFGKKLKKLRRQGILPANLFGKTTDSTAIQLKLRDFERVYKEAGETSVVYVKVEGEEKDRPVLISNLHFDPITDLKLHVDLHQVNLKEKVTANVPVEIVGEAELIKTGEAVLNQSINEIEVEALPTDIPDSITFDISGFKEIGDHLNVSDAKVPSAVEITTDLDLVVVSLSEPQKEEVIAPPVVEGEEGAQTTEGEPAKVEGEEAITGAEKTPDSETSKAE